MVVNVGDFIESSITELKKRFDSILKNSTLQDTERREIDCLLDAFSAPFSSLSSDYLRLKYFEKSGNHILATECVVGERYDYKFVANRIVGMPVPCTATHIPLRLTLKKFFELPGIFTTVLNHVNQLKCDDSVLSNFVQGNLWRKKSALYEAEGKTVLPLFLGIDDLEINNALGSHTGVSQVGAVYVSTPCLPPEFYAQLNNIFLNFLYYSQDRKLPNGNFEVFKNVVSELNFLARNGIWLKTESGNKRVNFVLGLILGDNKGLNEVLGFPGSFSANLYCRFCKRHRNDCSYDSEELSNYIRKSEDYETDVTLGVNVSGVKEKCVWLEVDYFDPVENFASCTLHDFDEGISRYAMPQICHFFISVAKIFDLAFLHERILSFNYQINGFSKKPSVITEDNLKKLNFKMSGSEMRTFVLCFNFLVGDYVPLECDVWRYYLVLRRLLEYVSCRAFPRQCLPQLKNLIEEHNFLYLKVFGPLKPKMHLLVHYPHILVESGPMPYLSMIRNEGKHKEIKEVQ
ncbi:uncharacterized protein LOC117181299 [Belonocnema kinseyi]|uniref:uncharacterized protein LOC117181299 n=1 Tax=Belonocnema kinseyi TaxID=2817044 RepID=UPI00143CC68D|nr:uncharacterized protein LOC117181299 [Belonocnema kinseyi]